MKSLKETACLMESSFYKARFAAEYLQLSIRLTKLQEMVKKWDENCLPFTPTCPRGLYDKQIKAMEEYLAVLVERARLENVSIKEYEEDTHDFAWAVQRILEGKRVALPEWAGYWYLGKDHRIWLYTKDGQILDTPSYGLYAQRRDWKVWDEINAQQLRDYQNK